MSMFPVSLPSSQLAAPAAPQDFKTIMTIELSKDSRKEVIAFIERYFAENGRGHRQHCRWRLAGLLP